MKILLVSYSDPLRRGGDELQSAALFRELVATGHQIGCITTAEPEEVPALQARLVASGVFPLGVRAVPREPYATGFRRDVATMLAGDPIDALAARTPKMRDAIRAAIETFSVDVIHAQSLRSSYFVPRGKGGPPVLLDLVDCLTRHAWLTTRFAVATGNWRAIPRCLVDVVKQARVERAVLTARQETMASALAETDAIAFRRLNAAGIPVRRVPPLCPLVPDREPPSPRPTDAPVLPFYGCLAQKHNLWALRMVMDKIFPRVRERFPAARLRVTGIDVPADVVRDIQNYPGATWEPAVDDLRSFLRSADVACFPFNFGSGFKTKVVESMAVGLPVVTTAEGVRGQPELAQAVGVKVADDPDQLARHVLNWLADPAGRAAAGAANLRVIHEHFTPQRKADVYLTLYRQLAESRKMGSR